ncbi:MAG: type IV pilus modification PilV family protein [Janthinobacterium lividum]
MCHPPMRRNRGLPMAQALPRHLAASAGFALLEALIAIMIFSLGVMALVGLQAAMSKNVTAAQLRGEASVLATELVGAMWLDADNLGNFAATGNVCATPAFATCSRWASRVAAQLPQGAANVSVNGSLVDVMLTWTLPGETPASYALQSSVSK